MNGPETGTVGRVRRETHHAVQSSGFFQNPVNSRLYGLFFRHIGLDGEDLAWVLFGYGGKVVACLADVDGVDF
jgi:hypothetical protein